jgi:hypothetical protein
MVGVDFTSSNGDPSDQDSLHYINIDQKYNDYQKAIKAIAEILLEYDDYKEVPVYGFGAKPNGSQYVNHSFPLTGDQKHPEVHGINGILEAYRNAISNIQFSGPSLFSPIIETAVNLASEFKKKSPYDYIILLLLTDGENLDMETVLDTIVASTESPLSIITVGIGNGDLTQMSVLDSDIGLRNGNGFLCQRDMVEFETFKEVNGDPEALARSLLKPIQYQVVDYYSLIGVKPLVTEADSSAIISEPEYQPSPGLHISGSNISTEELDKSGSSKGV